MRQTTERRQEARPGDRTGDRWPAGVRVHLRAGVAGCARSGWPRVRAEGRWLVQAGGRRRRVHVVSATRRRTVGSLLCPRVARLASPVASRASGPAGARRLLRRGDVAQRPALPGRPVAGGRQPWLAVGPHGRSVARDLADAGPAPVGQLPMAGPGDNDPAARQDRKRRRGQRPGCRAGEFARRLAPAARPAPLRSRVLAGAAGYDSPAPTRTARSPTTPTSRSRPSSSRRRCGGRRTR